MKNENTKVEHLSIRINPTNPNHHLWNNNGTWFLHCTFHSGCISERRRISLATKNISKARAMRDCYFSTQNPSRTEVENG